MMMRLACAALACMLGCIVDPPPPPNCADIPCSAAISAPSDHWIACKPQDATCELPRMTPTACMITAADVDLCVCRQNADATVTALCVRTRGTGARPRIAPIQARVRRTTGAPHP